MYIVYSGSFLSRQGDKWEIDLLRDLDAEPEEVGTLRFPAEEALTIEWDEVERWEVIQGSTATLRIISPGDRTYLGLYAIRVGEVRMDVYRNQVLFWSGTMDTEFYEEPYERGSDYEVTLTFSDLGVLERMKYDLGGMRTLRYLTQYALLRAGLGHLTLDDTSYISLSHEDGTHATPDTISMASENFYDEDGEPCTLQEVVEGILQPLSLRMVQRFGKVYVYDLYALQSKAPKRPVHWTSDSQTLGVASVVNNVKLTFSPYAKDKPLESQLEYTEPYDQGSTEHNLTGDTADSYSYYPACDDDNKLPDGSWDYQNISFRIWTGSGQGLAYSRYGYFRIEPIFGGSEAEGVPYAFRAGTVYNNNEGRIKVAGNFYPNHQATLRTYRAFLPRLSEEDAAHYYLRLTLPLLADGRYNPFTSDASGNKEDRNDYLKGRAHHLFVAVDVHLYDAPDATTASRHWSNCQLTTAITKNPNFADTLGEWLDGPDGWDGTAHDGWLAYYDKEEYSGGSPIGKGWITNRQCLGTPRYTFAGIDFAEVRPSIRNRDDGQYIPYPAEGGWLEVTVYGCPWPVNRKTSDSYYPGVTTITDDDAKGCMERMAWLLLKAPEVEVTDRTLKANSIDQEELEYRGNINPEAKEEVSLDTICGSAPEAMPTSRGCYLRTADGLQLSRLRRGTLTEQPERILIGSIYGQAAERKATLSGEARIEVDGAGRLLLYTEQNQPADRLFLTTAETLDAQSDTTELTLTELSNVTYIPEST